MKQNGEYLAYNLKEEATHMKIEQNLSHLQALKRKMNTIQSKFLGGASIKQLFPLFYCMADHLGFLAQNWKRIGWSL